MTKQEEILTLRKFPRHYLWNKPRNQWTPEDLENLKNGVTKSRAAATDDSPMAKQKTPVVLVVGNEKKEFNSVKELSEFVPVPYQSLVNILNGANPQRKEFQIFKSKINQ